MNIALNLLKPKQIDPAVSTVKNTNSKPKSQQKTSFSDSLNNAVSQSNKTVDPEKNQNPVEQLNPDEPNLVNTSVVPIGMMNLVNISLDSTTGQTETELPVILDNDSTETDAVVELIPPGQDMLIALQMQIPVQTANNEGAVVPTEESTTLSVTASTTDVPVVFGQNVQSLATPADNDGIETSPTNQSANLISGLIQGTQEQPATPTNGSNQANTQASTQANAAAQTKATQEVLTSSSAVTQPVSTEAVLAVQSKDIAVKADKLLNGIVGDRLQQVTDQSLVPAANLLGESLHQQSNGEQHQESSTDQTLFAQSQTSQEIVADTDAVFSPHIIAPGVESLLAKGDSISVTATNETQQQANSLTDTHQVVAQIVEQAKVVTKLQNTEMIIKLKPEHLGELTLKVVVENGAVNASFHSNNAEVRNVIEASLPQLKQELANNGLKVENVSVYAGLSQFSPNQDHDRNSRQQTIKLNNKKSSGDFIEAIGSENESGKVTGLGSQSGVDYRI